MKKEIRKVVSLRLKNMTDAERDEKSTKICAEVVANEHFVGADSVFVYLSDFREVRTDAILLAAEKSGKKIFVPYVIGEKMLAVLLTKPLAEVIFSLNQWGIKEPTERTIIAQGSDIDVIIVPAVALTKNCERLGHGKGYYDRFFEDCAAYKIGVCYSEQLFDTLPTEPHDILLDEIVYE